MNMPKPANDDRFLTGKLLLAMPAIDDERFSRSVIFICAHDENGAMGLVLNREMAGLNLDKLIEDLELDASELDIIDEDAFQIFEGGPVEIARGFLLHGTDYEREDTVPVTDEFRVTGTIEGLAALLQGKGPAQYRFILGYAGWTAGQLDHEVQDNAWLVIDATPELVFDCAPDEQWEAAVKTLGFDPAMLSTAAGRA